MKPEKKILIIDDVSQRKEIENIKRRLNELFKTEVFNIRTSESVYRLNGSNDADLEKIKEAILKVFQTNRHFDLVLTDFDLNAPFDGLDVVKYIKDNWDIAPIMIYSGKISQIVKRILDTDVEQLNKEQVIVAVSKLFNYHIIDCVERLDYVEKAANYLKKDREISFRTTLICLLYAHSDIEFKSCFPEFKGMKFGEIANVIENRSDQRSDEWVKTILEQTIAYLVKVNNE